MYWSVSDWSLTRAIFIYVTRGGGNGYFNVCYQTKMGGSIKYFGGRTFWSLSISKNIHRTDIFIRGVDKYIRRVYIFISEIF
jgi:hypothetical protein